MTLQNSREPTVHETDFVSSTALSIRGIIRLGRPTRPSGCMTLQNGWRHGGANWHFAAPWEKTTTLVQFPRAVKLKMSNYARKRPALRKTSRGARK
jgi:hypothetical protein